MFQVEWTQSALSKLAAIWNQADSEQRQAITVASHLLEQRLQTNPHGEGESRSQGRRITFIPPLAAIFRIKADGHTVTVLHVQIYGRQ
jgi:plasmid stabilization system protein ParE